MVPRGCLAGVRLEMLVFVSVADEYRQYRMQTELRICTLAYRVWGRPRAPGCSTFGGRACRQFDLRTCTRLFNHVLGDPVCRSGRQGSSEQEKIRRLMLETGAGKPC